MTEMPPLPDVPAEAPAAAPRRRRPLLVAVAALVLLLVAGAGFAGGLLAGRPPAERYNIMVMLEKDAGEADQAGVRTALEGLHPDGAVRFVTREQAAARMQETYKDRPDVLKYTTAENLADSFEADLVTRAVTCAGITGLRDLPGVDVVTFVRRPHGTVPGAQIAC